MDDYSPNDRFTKRKANREFWNGQVRQTIAFLRYCREHSHMPEFAAQARYLTARLGQEIEMRRSYVYLDGKVSAR